MISISGPGVFHFQVALHEGSSLANFSGSVDLVGNRVAGVQWLAIFPAELPPGPCGQFPNASVWAPTPEIAHGSPSYLSAGAWVIVAYIVDKGNVSFQIGDQPSAEYVITKPSPIFNVRPVLANPQIENNVEGYRVRFIENISAPANSFIFTAFTVAAQKPVVTLFEMRNGIASGTLDCASRSRDDLKGRQVNSTILRAPVNGFVRDAVNVQWTGSYAIPANPEPEKTYLRIEAHVLSQN